MSTNCIKCVRNPRTGPDLLCNTCREQDAANYRILCAFCGGGSIDRRDPDWTAKAASHILECPKHPLAEYVIRNAAYATAAEKIRQHIEASKKAEHKGWDGCPFVVPADLIEDLLEAHKKATTP